MSNEFVRVIPEELYEMCAAQNERAAMYRLLMSLNTDLSAGRFAEVDELLAALDTTKLAPVVLLSALSFTLPAASHLPSRTDFLHRAEIHLRATLGDERAERLLDLRR